MRKRARFESAVWAIVIVAAFGLLSVVGGRNSLAQQSAQCTVLHGAEGGILDGASGEQALKIESCFPGVVELDGPTLPEVGGTVYPDGPPPPGYTYSYIFDGRPCDLPGGSDLPGAKVTVKFWPPPSMKADTQMVLTLAPDKDKPTLNTTSTPRKGTKVKPGDTIKVRMEASEEYTYPRRYNWQTGVKKIQLTDESRNQVVPPHWEGTGGPRPCAAKQWKHWLEVTYTVPPNPPPIIRLRAIAEDFAGNKDDDLGEFPTGDWFGTAKKTAKGGGFNQTVEIDFAFEIERSGTIKGRARGRVVRTEEDQVPGCTILWTYSPSEFEIPLSGRRNDEDFEIELERVATTATNRTTCPHAGSHSSTLRFSPIVHGVNKFRVSAQDLNVAISNHLGALPWAIHTDDSIEIHQVRQ